MEDNIRIATPEEAEENKRKQRIMLNHGINVKIDGSWGSWQNEQWNKIQPTLVKEQALRKEKLFEFWIGILFLIPPILGVLSFFLQFLGVDGDFPELSMFKYTMWTGDYNEGGGFTSALPIYIGLMSIAGAYLIKDAAKFVFTNTAS